MGIDKCNRNCSGRIFIWNFNPYCDMKRLIVFFAAALVSALSLNAQDVITRTDGTEIIGRIIESNEKTVKYKSWTDPQGPTYFIPSSDILMIRYDDGQSEVFPAGRAVLSGMNSGNGLNSPVAPAYRSAVMPGLKYRDIKDLYDPYFYSHQPGDPYSRFLAGTGSFFFTGLGQGIDGEWGRAFNFFAAYWGLRALAWATADYVYYDFSNGFHSDVSYNGISAVFRLGVTAMKIWSIVDAIRVAKVKNMYHQDLRRGYSGLDFKVEPFLSMEPSVAPYGIEAAMQKRQPVAGLSLRVSF